MSADSRQVREGAARYLAEAHEQDVPHGYKRTEVGVIPEDWEVESLLRALYLPTGQVDPRREPYRSMILVAPDHVEAETGRLLISQTAADQQAISGKYPFKAGDIVYSKIRPYLRKAIVADFDGLCSADMYPLSAAPNVSARFMIAVLLGHDFSIFAESVSARSGIPKINRAELAEYRLALPPPHEQRAIAEALSDVDGLLGSLEALIAKKRAIKQAAMQQLLTGNTRLPGFSRPWETKRLGEVVERLVGGGTPSRGNPSYWDGEIPWVTVKDFATFNPQITQESITRLGLNNSSSHLIPAGTLITSTRMALGKAVIFDVGVAINQDLKAVFLGPRTSVKYLYYWFECNARMIDDLGSGSTVKGISIGHLAALPFPSPSIDEQTAIAAVLSDMDAEIDALECRAAKTRAIKQGMMQQLLTGRVRLVGSS